ncbi:MAG: DUF4093 domain-containing protein [Clostridia bacterium]|nr:DUF4093 domain-containing protein [Clostridia bacterium]
MIRFKIPVIVEGRYDKAHLASLIDAVIIPTDGFGVFKNPERRALIKRLGQNGLILLCDSDGGGNVIRSHLKGQLGGTRVYDLYIPQIAGKEKRKAAPSKAGFLGVEGVDAQILLKIFEDFAAAHPETVEDGTAAAERTPVTRSMLFELRLSGGANAQENRDRLCEKLGLPKGMNANALFAAVNMISSADDVERLCKNHS